MLLLALTVAVVLVVVAALLVAVVSVVSVVAVVVAGTPHPYQLHLLLTTSRQHPFYSVLLHFRHVRSSYEASESTCRDCKLELRILDLLSFGGGDDDDIVTQTPRTIPPEEPLVYSGFAVLS